MYDAPQRKMQSIADLVDGLPAWKLCIYLAYLCMVVYILTPSSMIGGDSPGIAYLPASILRHGTLRLDPYINGDYLFDLSNNPHYVVESNGHYYSKFSPLPSILALPVYGLSFMVTGLPDETTQNVVVSYIKLSKLTASMIATATIITVFLVLRRVLQQHYAVLMALVYAFGAHTWTTATKTLATQSTGELFLALGFLCLLKVEEHNQTSNPRVRRTVFLAGCSISFAVAARMQLLPVVLILSVYIVHKYWRDTMTWLCYALGAVPAITVLAAYNTWAFGVPWSTGYGSEVLQGWTTPIWVGLPGILVSPTHGLLVYSPVFLFAIAGGMAVWAQHRQDAYKIAGKQNPVVLGRYMVVCAFVQLILMSHWWAWYGGVAYNQRMLQEIHPILIFLSAVGLLIYNDKPWLKRLFVAAVLWGVFMNLSRTAFYTQHLEWVETYRPTMIWTIQFSEIAMYLKWHGLAGFIAGIGKVLLRIGPISILSTAIFMRLFVLQGIGQTKR